MRNLLVLPKDKQEKMTNVKEFIEFLVNYVKLFILEKPVENAAQDMSAYKKQIANIMNRNVAPQLFSYFSYMKLL